MKTKAKYSEKKSDDERGVVAIPYRVAGTASQSRDLTEGREEPSRSTGKAPEERVV